MRRPQAPLRRQPRRLPARRRQPVSLPPPHPLPPSRRHNPPAPHQRRRRNPWRPPPRRQTLSAASLAMSFQPSRLQNNASRPPPSTVPPRRTLHAPCHRRCARNWPARRCYRRLRQQSRQRHSLTSASWRKPSGRSAFQASGVPRPRRDVTPPMTDRYWPRTAERLPARSLPACSRPIATPRALPRHRALTRSASRAITMSAPA